MNLNPSGKSRLILIIILGYIPAVHGQDAAGTVVAAQTAAQNTVEAFFHKSARPRCVFTFLEWSNFSTDGDTASINVRFRLSQPGQNDVVSAARFTLQNGAVIRQEVVPVLLPRRAVPLFPSSTPAPAFAPEVIDHFSDLIAGSLHVSPMSLQLTDAFSLSQLDEAKKKAESEQKPLGFVMVWGQFFGTRSDTRSDDSISALVQFYKVFNKDLVLVFVRHETELGAAPAAARQGFRGPDEGGFAPNMAVTDASGTEFIVEIPYRNKDGAGRAKIFAEGGKKIDAWLAAHPKALPTPPPAAPPAS